MGGGGAGAEQLKSIKAEVLALIYVSERSPKPVQTQRAQLHLALQST